MFDLELTNFWINILLPVFSILIPVFATIYTVNNRIKNQNKENHQPYIVLDSVVDIDDLNEYSYYLTPIGRNFAAANEKIDYQNLKSKSDINVKLILKNIGYGVATNIKFYNLLTGEQVHGTQENSIEHNQKLFTTFDMEAGDEKGVQARVINLVTEYDGFTTEDHIRMLCVYHDLHGNTYNFIVSINAKGGGHYDFFAYQPSSKSYKKWRAENNKQFKMIKKEYK